MRLETRAQDIHCPYCGERFEIVIDLSALDQEYIEDCYVCCRPMVVSVFEDAGGEAVVQVRGENDA